MDLLPNAALDLLKNDVIPKDICVVGAGAGGLIMLKAITDTPQYKAGLWRVTAFDKRDAIGGVWYPAAPIDDPPATPLYDSLTTNLPHPIMAFHDFPFPPSTPLFPPASTVHKYLEDFAAHYKLDQHICLRTAVTAASWDDAAGKWAVCTSDGMTRAFDTLLIAHGHYSVPRMPETPGLAAWLAAGKAQHSAWYRRPEELGRTVLVVGGGPSGMDIAAEMRTTADTVLHAGARMPPLDPTRGGGVLHKRPRVAEFLDPSTGAVRYEDGSRDTGIDFCILATGYRYTFAFLPPELLRAGAPPPVPPLPAALHNTSYSVFPLARHLFPLVPGVPPRALAFLGLLMRLSPLPAMEAQALAVVRVLADPTAFDATQEAVRIVARYEELAAKLGNDDVAVVTKEWHRFEELEQFSYRDELLEFAGVPERVPSWAREIYPRVLAMRGEWRELERKGEADDWARGVGEGGEDEWVKLMYRILQRVDEQQEQEEVGEKTKL